MFSFVNLISAAAFGWCLAFMVLAIIERHRLRLIVINGLLAMVNAAFIAIAFFRAT